MDKGFDFRNTGAFVKDPANCTYAVLVGYPTIQAGVTMGWASTPAGGLFATANQSTTVDPRLAGNNQCTNTGSNGTGSQPLWRLDLPHPGQYRIQLAMGDLNFTQGYQHLEIKDSGSTIYTIDKPNGTSPPQFIDATGVIRTSAADWVANQQSIILTFNTSVLVVALCSLTTGFGTGSSCINHLRVTSLDPVSLTPIGGGSSLVSITPIGGGSSLAGINPY